METLGYVGLGLMGLPMTRRLLAAGHAVTVWNRSPEKREAAVQSGALAAADPAGVAAKASIVFMCLTDAKAVEAVVFGPGGLAQVAGAGKVVVDFSSIHPDATRDIARRLHAANGMRWVDAPVSGGTKGAEEGSLAIMAGGPAAEVERGRPVLAAMGKSIFATGLVGSGHAMKALNNYVSAAGLIAACEALLVGQTFGLAPETIVDVLNASTGRNNSTEVKMKPFVISGAFNSGFSLALMAKDLRIAADLAAHLGLGIPQIATVADLWEQAKGTLKTDADHTEIYRFLADIDANRPHAA